VADPRSAVGEDLEFVIPGREHSETNPESILPVLAYAYELNTGDRDSGLVLRTPRNDVD
jgi:hypothetical protein